MKERVHGFKRIYGAQLSALAMIHLDDDAGWVVHSPPGLFGGSDGSVVHLLLLGVLRNLLLVLGNRLLLGLGSSLLQGLEVTLALESHGGDEALRQEGISMRSTR